MRTPKAFDGVNTLYIFTKLLRRDASSVVLLLLVYDAMFVRVVRGIGEDKSHF